MSEWLGGHGLRTCFDPVPAVFTEYVLDAFPRMRPGPESQRKGKSSGVRLLVRH